MLAYNREINYYRNKKQFFKVNLDYNDDKIFIHTYINK